MLVERASALPRSVDYSTRRHNIVISLPVHLLLPRNPHLLFFFTLQEKIRKLVDIWEKGQTFPLSMLNSFKEKLSTPAAQSKIANTTASPSHRSFRMHDSNHTGLCVVPQSTTPPGSPPPLNNHASSQQTATTGAPNTSSILAALANMARQQQHAAPAPPSTQGIHNQDSLYTMPNAQNNPAQQVAALNQSLPVPPVAPSVNVPGLGASYAQHLQAANGAAQNYSSNPSNPYPVAPPAIAQPAAALDPAVQQSLVLIKSLSDAGVPADQIAGIIAQLGNQGAAAAGAVPGAQYHPQNQIPSAQNGWSGRPDESRDHNAYIGGVRSPAGQYRRRSRSPSPHRGWNARDSPSSRRRDDGYDRGRGGGRGDYRQRSPPHRGHTETPPYGGGEKWVGHDASIPKGSIKGTYMLSYRVLPQLTK